MSRISILFNHLGGQGGPTSTWGQIEWFVEVTKRFAGVIPEYVYRGPGVRGTAQKTASGMHLYTGYPQYGVFLGPDSPFRCGNR